MKSVRYNFQDRKMIRSKILNFFILSTSILMILFGILMVFYCSIIVDPPISVIYPYLQNGALIIMGISGIRLYQNEGSFDLNLSSNNFPKLLPKTGSKTWFKSDHKGLMLLKKPAGGINSLESIQELKIPNFNIDAAPISIVKDQKRSDYEVLPLPKIEGIDISGDKNLYDILSKTINQTIKDIQEIVQLSKLPRGKLLAYKNEAFRSGVIFEQKGDFQSAMANYSIAYEIAKELGLEDEVKILQLSVKRLLTHFSLKEGKKLMKKTYMTSAFFQLFGDNQKADQARNWKGKFKQLIKTFFKES